MLVGRQYPALGIFGVWGDDEPGTSGANYADATATPVEGVPPAALLRWRTISTAAPVLSANAASGASALLTSWSLCESVLPERNAIRGSITTFDDTRYGIAT